MLLKKITSPRVSITPVTVKVVDRVEEGFPVQKVTFVEKEEVTNSYEELCKTKSYDPNQLEIALATGESLTRVNSKILESDMKELVDTLEENDKVKADSAK